MSQRHHSALVHTITEMEMHLERQTCYLGSQRLDSVHGPISSRTDSSPRRMLRQPLASWTINTDHIGPL